MKCPKCKIEADIIDASIVIKNGSQIQILEVVCPSCGQVGHKETVLGKVVPVSTQ